MASPWVIEKRRSGSSDLILPVLGIGCWAYGGGEGDYWGTQNDRDAQAVVDNALISGANYFDTAEGYNDGRSEEALGRVLKNRRSEAIIGTKVSPSNARPDLLRQHCEASLQRLQTDVIDLYMVHWPITDFPVAPAFETLASLQSEGKIRHIGLSNFGVHQLREAVSTGVKIVSNQLCYNLLSRAIEYEILPECQRLEIGVVAYMPYMQGLLTGKYHSADVLPPERTRTRHFRGDRPLSRHGEAGAEGEVFDVLDKLRVIASEMGIHMAHLALAWVIQQPGIACALAGIRTQNQLEDALAGASIRLAPVLLEELDTLTAPLKKILGPNADFFQGQAGSRVI